MEHVDYKVNNVYRLNDQFVILVCQDKMIKVRDENIIPRFVSPDSVEAKQKYKAKFLHEIMNGPNNLGSGAHSVAYSARGVPEL